MSELPSLSPEQAAHSAAVARHISDLIAAEGGWMPFSRYMSLALYAPGLGYYSAGAQKLGASGDFVTAPEISALYGQCVARQIDQALPQIGTSVLEFGAGSGKLAIDILGELERAGNLPEHYLILEVSPDLRARQAEAIAKHTPHLAPRVQWLDELPTHFEGVVVANEVLDAMPVELVYRRNGEWFQRGVIQSGQAFQWDDRPLTSEPLLRRARALDIPEEYIAELHLEAGAFVSTLGATLARGLVLLIDYGFAEREYYHPQRDRGTLMCHFRHRAHDDPFNNPGLEDITAHVNFSAIAEAGCQSGLALLGYTTQANFLINCGITDILARVSPTDPAAYLPLANQAQRLLSPAEMGDLFKVMAFGKSFDEALIGFSRGDRSNTL